MGRNGKQQTHYSWETYKYANGADDKLTKYCTKATYGDNGFKDGKTSLDMADDVARVLWKGKWRMPKEEWKELHDFCTWEWTTQDGKNGYKVTSKKNNKSIFLPAAGRRFSTTPPTLGVNGYYWCRSISRSASDQVWTVRLKSDDVSLRIAMSRMQGLSVRPVCKANNPVMLTLSAEGGSKADTILCDAGQVLNLEATAQMGYKFSQWSDGNTENPRAITMDTDSVLEAIFTRLPILEVLIEPEGAGSVYFNGNPVSHNKMYYPFGALVTLTNQANEGDEFVRWECDEDESSAAEYQVRMNKAKTVTAYFKKLTEDISNAFEEKIEEVVRVLRDGHIFILRDGKTYDLMGKEIK